MTAPVATSPPSTPPPHASLLPVFLIVLVDVFGMTLVIPLLAIYAESFHATPLQATLLVSVFAACQLVSGPLIGFASDRTGRKPMLIISQIGTFIGFIVLARATSLWMIYLARVIDGSTAGNLSLAQAYISDNTPPEDRAKKFGLIGIAFGLGFFIGPSLTGFLSARFGLTAPIYLAAGMSATSVLCTTFLLSRRQADHHARAPPRGTGLADLRAVLRAARAAGPLVPVPVLHPLVLDVHLRVRAVRRAPVHLAGPSVRAARDRVRVRLRGPSGHHSPGRADRTAGQDVR